MLRVLGTIQHSQYSKKMKKQAKDLAGWVSQIHNGIYPHLVRPLPIAIRNTRLKRHRTANDWALQELRRRQHFL